MLGLSVGCCAAGCSLGVGNLDGERGREPQLTSSVTELLSGHDESDSEHEKSGRKDEGDTSPALSAALGRRIFFDENLSAGNNQSCGSCHFPRAGFTGELPEINAAGAVYEGSVPGRFGNRKPPSSAYATLSPVLHVEIVDGEEILVGGNFWDGRATGERLGSPAADQAQGPFLNPLEQALDSGDEVVQRVCDGAYGRLFRRVWGRDSCDPANAAASFDSVALSIVAYEDSKFSNRFSSKFDRVQKRLGRFTSLEREGLELFDGKAHCSRCHVDSGQRPAFTDFTYGNLGVPRNPENPWYENGDFNPAGYEWVDEGLGGFLSTRADYVHLAEANRGRQKVPTLRNVDKRPNPSFPKAYMHNGYFKSLEAVVHFYNTRDVLPVCPDRFTTEADAMAQGCWPEPEVPDNVNHDDLGDLGLSAHEEAALVAFLETLSDVP